MFFFATIEQFYLDPYERARCAPDVRPAAAQPRTISPDAMCAGAAQARCYRENRSAGVISAALSLGRCIDQKSISRTVQANQSRMCTSITDRSGAEGVGIPAGVWMHLFCDVYLLTCRSFGYCVCTRFVWCRETLHGWNLCCSKELWKRKSSLI